ncbi:unnamed protein product [Rotaria sordida]|uniref:Uncharacterized protein n=1 Tax=Rotaria sordida TaxID=392033 RepID=A0A814Q7E6_9BILA|nr:unnamed protein product [Rotaria sordida]CAF3538298.1 unnamed protein product [Rotaria sordida]
MITNNSNTSTPDLYNQQACHIINETQKIGRMSEMGFFFEQIDYWQTAADEKFDINYFNQFIEAIGSKTALPQFDTKNHYVKRAPSAKSGLDIDDSADDYYVNSAARSIVIVTNDLIPLLLIIDSMSSDKSWSVVQCQSDQLDSIRVATVLCSSIITLSSSFIVDSSSAAHGFSIERIARLLEKDPLN